LPFRYSDLTDMAQCIREAAQCAKLVDMQKILQYFTTPNNWVLYK